MRCAILLLMLTFALAGATTSAADEPEHTAGPVPEGHDILFVGGRRLVVIRFEIIVDGRPAHEVWNEYLNQQYQQLDQDGDGSLSRDERRRLPSRQLFEAMNFIPPSDSARAASSLLAQDPRASVTDRAKLERYVEHIGFRPFQVAAQAAPRPRYITSSGRVQAVSANTGKMLFGQLDQNGDGAVDATELDQASRQLGRTDFDNDESVSSIEIDPLANNPYRIYEQSETVSDAVPFIALDRSTHPRGRAERVMELLAAPAMKSRPAAERRLVPSDLDHSEEFFATHDRDGSGEIDFEELVAVLDALTPGVVVTIQYGRRDPGRRPVEARIVNLPEVAVTPDSEKVKVAFSGIEIVFSLGGMSREKPADQLQQIFRSADGDNNGYLDRDESGQLGSMRRAFSDLDSDRNGQVFLEEFQKGLEPVVTAGRQQFQLAVDMGGFDLFRALDTNRDGRLTTREIRALPEQVLTWDRNGDRKVHTGELPQRYELTVGSGSGSAVREGRIVEEVRPSPSQPRPGIRSLLGTVATPVWFSRMDRNEDGDLSPREFLGAEADFRKLDRNADGLISADEAIKPTP